MKTLTSEIGKEIDNNIMNTKINPIIELSYKCGIDAKKAGKLSAELRNLIFKILKSQNNNWIYVDDILKIINNAFGSDTREAILLKKQLTERGR